MGGLEMPPDVEYLLNSLLERAEDILEDQFIGMYVYGSLATGDYVPDRSDVDFVVVTKSTIKDTLVRELQKMHEDLHSSGPSLARKLEGAYVPRQVLRHHDHDHPKVPTINEGSFYLAPLGPDWLIQRATLRDNNPRLAGPPAKDLIDPIEFSEIKVAILSAINDWWEPIVADQADLRRPGYQPYAVLSMCRALYAIELGGLSSKEQAGKWAMNTLHPKWHPLIEAALAWREGDEVESIEDTARFMEEVIRLCRKGA